MFGVRTGGMISDHAVVCFTLSVTKSRVDDEWRTTRAWRRLSCDALASDLAAYRLCTNHSLTTSPNSTVLC